MSILSSIHTPSDLKSLSFSELRILSEEIREFMIEKVKLNGGHLASNLGIVELTLTLHRVFDFSRDRLIFDVSHQSYVHKILTGRRSGFDQLRQWQGLSGFTDPEESLFDSVKVGHAGASISTALGFKTGFDLCGETDQKKVIAFIGDASISNGMAFEALNHLGHLKKNLIIVLNDNQMSISKTVGGFSKYLSRFLTGNFYYTLKKDVEKMLGALPVIGEPINESLKNMVKTLRKNLNPNLFEEFGVNYVGPVNGYDLEEMEKIFQNVRDHTHGPMLIHTITQKGKGFAEAEKNPTKYHGISSGKTLKTKSFTEVFGEKMVQLAAQRNDFSVITAAMTDGTGLVQFAETFPHRYFDVGIAEEHAAAFAGGISMAGHKPVVAIYSTFLQRTVDQLFQEASLQPSSHPVFVMDRSGLVGEDGPTHHGVFDIAYTRFLPRFILMAPKDGKELEMMLEHSLTLKQPCVIRFPKGGFPHFESCEPVATGKSEILRENSQAQVTLVSYGSMTGEIQKITEILDLNFNWINLRFVKPLDEETLLRFASLELPMVILEEHSLMGGVGERISALLSDQGKRVPLLRIGLEDHYYAHGSREILLESAGLAGKPLAERILNFLNSEEKAV